MRTRKIHVLLATFLALTSALLIADNPHAEQEAPNQGSQVGSSSAGVSSSGDGGGSIEASVTITYTSPGSTPTSQTTAASTTGQTGTLTPLTTNIPVAEIQTLNTRPTKEP
ncbi:hypothetical protein [Actinomyces procaprae]|uniref:hypothetical protein n=1 Tax=Actinomyces procaprae TaxID=2560010 RepID=UPI00109DC4A6|nr:hypothetical protein [Actinomyces procaprae]